ncbi:hypothetical protein WMY93_026640 [Mugilogobius chulae]|uniref:Ig-like domain-containing protein n=1 Tax=Mugilogobius chulae TaxID=88201 RepID=A0AAW0MZP7_9GOBI
MCDYTCCPPTTAVVKARRLSSELELDCRYSEVSQVHKALWKHQNESIHLDMETSLGSITTSIPLPVRAESAGNYTCVLLLKNKQTVSATYTVTLPSTSKARGEM